MAILADVLPKNDDGRIIMSPVGDNDGVFMDGSVGYEWFKSVFPEPANATLPLAQKHYDTLKAIDKFWEINTINWRKNGVIPVYNIKPEDIIEEEEAFLLEMYPPAEEEEEEPTTTEETTEGA